MLTIGERAVSNRSTMLKEHSAEFIHMRHEARVLMARLLELFDVMISLQMGSRSCGGLNGCDHATVAFFSHSWESTFKEVSSAQVSSPASRGGSAASRCLETGITRSLSGLRWWNGFYSVGSWWGSILCVWSRLFVDGALIHDCSVVELCEITNRGVHFVTMSGEKCYFKFVRWLSGHVSQTFGDWGKKAIDNFDRRRL